MSLTDRERRLTRLFAACVLGRWQEVTRLRRTAPSGEPDRAWREVLLQVHVFAGFPRLVEAYGVLDEAGGLGSPAPEELLAEPDQPERGRALFDRIYARGGERVHAMLCSYHPDFAAWIEGHAYGRVLARPGLETDQRELLAVAALTVLGQERQLASHARGSVRCGATLEQLEETLDVVADLVPEELIERARGIVQRFARAEEGEEQEGVEGSQT